MTALHKPHELAFPGLEQRAGLVVVGREAVRYRSAAEMHRPGLAEPLGKED